jgi:tryptophan synthase beta subunit
MVGPQHADLFSQNRVTYAASRDDEVVDAFKLLAKTEGIIPALESSHALAYVCKHAHTWAKTDYIVINLSGRGDKDLPQLFERNLLE